MRAGLKNLTPDMVATLRQLRREVDDLQDDLMRTTGAQLNTQTRLYAARDRLRDFTTNLRKDGYLV